MTPSAALEGFLHLTETDVPLLETVLIGRDDDAPHGFWESLGILRAARMSEFSIPSRSFVAEVVLLRWHQLETLILGAPSPSSLASFSNEATVQAISRCPNLRCCKLWLSDLNAAFPAQSQLPVVELPFLHTLELRNRAYFPTASIPFILECLSAPNLRRLILGGAALEIENTHPLPRFLTVSTCLEELDVDIHSISASSLPESIRSLSDTLQRLVIRRGFSLSQPDFDDDTLDLLVPAAPGRAFCCPALNTLMIEGSRISDPALLRFITARMEMDGGSTLQKVLLHFDRRRTLELDLPLAPFMKAGLQVYIMYYPNDSSKLSPWCGMNNPYLPTSTSIISQSLAVRTLAVRDSESSYHQIESFLI
ncbi:hypothetical protein B0H16DRAFT_1881754 [Mycena metata]|uniref:F-box domain-containing protein n=1 Tax=Mycena metata TaxID=1033252 RepID=A0AAD7JUN7_9AGAR|nr:hypothetical protein B0H16DRAFT_1881754 [Mycena metata]